MLRFLKLATLVTIGLLNAGAIYAGDVDRVITLSNAQARPLAMGGAFTSMVDDLAAIRYNPASYELYLLKKSGRLTLFLNPISPVAGAIQKDELFSATEKPGEDLLIGLGMVLRSFAVSFNSFEFGFLLGEESISRPDMFHSEELLNASGFAQNHSHTVLGKVKLAEKVSVGASANLVYQSRPDEPLKRRSGIGISYGVLLKPEDGLRIGVSFVNLPDSLDDYRLDLERFVDESINVGISYQLANSTVSVDVRNLGEDERTLVREFHLGLEQVFLSNFALRAGWFRKTNGDDVYSWGIGLLDSNNIWGDHRSFSHPSFLLNYAFVYDNNPLNNIRWHYLSFHFRL